jgi:hypothetical protein
MKTTFSFDSSTASLLVFRKRRSTFEPLGEVYYALLANHSFVCFQQLADRAFSPTFFFRISADASLIALISVAIVTAF